MEPLIKYLLTRILFEFRGFTFLFQLIEISFKIVTI